jgi:hypothetical protein
METHLPLMNEGREDSVSPKCYLSLKALHIQKTVSSINSRKSTASEGLLTVRVSRQTSKSRQASGRDFKAGCRDSLHLESP